MTSDTTKDLVSSVTVTRRLEWDSAHRVLRHESKCGSLHGHRYVALVTVTAAELDHCDRVVDFGVIKQLVGDWIDRHWDHTTLVNRADVALLDWCVEQANEHDKRAPYVFGAEPTAETIAAELLSVCETLLEESDVVVLSVEVFETPNCSAKVVAL